MMPKAFTQIIDKLGGIATLIEMMQRIEAKLDRLLTALDEQKPAATAKPIVQVDETTAAKMERAGAFDPTGKGKK